MSGRATQAHLDAVARVDFPTFFRLAFPILNPKRTFVEAWHVGAIEHVLDEMASGRRHRQIINLAPSTMKSQIVSVAWPAFLLGRDPACEIFVTSYTETLSGRLSFATRSLMQSELYQRLFPQTRLVLERVDLVQTDLLGYRLATTIGGATTGIGADWIIFDDPHNAAEAGSEAARERVWNYFSRTLSTRLNDPSQGRIIVVMQRVHYEDLSGRLLRIGGWEHLRLPARASEDMSVLIGPGQFHAVRTGDLLLPTRLTADWLESQQRMMGACDFAAQYQQEPIPADGAMVKLSWLKFDTPPPRSAGTVTLSLDAAFKANPANDYSVCTVWLEHDGKHYLLDVWREKTDFPGLRAALLALHRRFDADHLLIEDAGAGSSLIQVLKHEGLPAVARKVKDSKEARLSAISDFIESGLMVLPLNAPWLAPFQAELLSFPGSRHDDQVDSLSQYFAWVRERRPKAEFSVFWT